MHIIIAFSWLLVLLLAMIIGTPAMPVSGEAGILPTFQVPPYAPTAAQPVTVEVPHLSVTIGIGYSSSRLALLLAAWLFSRKSFTLSLL